MTKRYRAGVIGHTGRGGYGHGLDRVYLEMDEIDIIAVADDDPDGLREAGQRLGVDRLYRNYHEMLKKEWFDIVSICPRWLGQRLDMVHAVAAAGACIILEKPMARTLAEADEMIEACEQAGIMMGIAHQGRMHSAVRYAKQILADGAIGDILTAQMQGKEDRRGGGEDLMVLGTHLFDTLRFILGRNPVWVYAHVAMDDGRPVTLEDAVEGPEELGLIAGDRIHAMYGFGHGVTATFESRRNQKDANRYGLKIFGTEGIMTVFDASQQIRIYESPFWRPDMDVSVRDVTAETFASSDDQNSHTQSDLQMKANVAIVRDVLQARAEGRRPINSGYDGRWALEMIHGVYAAHLAGAPFSLPLANRTHPLEGVYA